MLEATIKRVSSNGDGELLPRLEQRLQQAAPTNRRSIVDTVVCSLLGVRQPAPSAGRLDT
jgi:hypothetical protein